MARRCRPLILNDNKFDPDLVLSSPCDATLPARPTVLGMQQHEIIRNVLVSRQHQSSAAVRHVEKCARHKCPVIAIGDPNAVVIALPIERRRAPKLLFRDVGAEAAKRRIVVGLAPGDGMFLPAQAQKGVAGQGRRKPPDHVLKNIPRPVSSCLFRALPTDRRYAQLRRDDASEIFRISERAERRDRR